jgi:hypothetical protein
VDVELTRRRLKALEQMRQTAAHIGGAAASINPINRRQWPNGQESRP